MADEIRVEYEQLQQIAAQFARQAQAIGQMQGQLKSQMNRLQGGWIGKGSAAFFAEMADKVLPATARLAGALEEAGKTTRQIADLMDAAERDAAAPFHGGERAGDGGHDSVVAVLGAAFLGAGVVMAGAGVASNIYRSLTGSAGEKSQIKAAQDALKDVKGLKPEEWKSLDTAGRLAVLNQVEQALAKAAGRAPFNIETAEFPPGKLGEYNGAVLKVSASALQGDNLHSIVETIAHEGRHAYQDYAIHHDGFHPDQKEVDAWRDAWDKPSDPAKIGMKRYWNLPFEQDARHFGDQFADTVVPQSAGGELVEEMIEVGTGLGMFDQKGSGTP